jgi:RHS repeat-associated protein
LSHGNAKADPTTGWSDHGARWLAADLGRWLAPDPPLDQPDAEAMMGQPGKLNPYVALSNNPIVLEDPDGAEPITLIVIGAATGAVAVYSWVKAGIYATNEQAALKSNTRQDLYDTGVVAAKAGVAAAAGTVGVAWAVGAGVALEGGEQLILEVTDDVEGISAGRVMLKTVGGAMGGLLGGLAGTLKQQGVGRKARYFIELAVGTKLGGTRDVALVQITKGQAHAIQRKDERQRLSELEQWENGGGSCTPTDEGAALCV